MSDHKEHLEIINDLEKANKMLEERLAAAQGNELQAWRELVPYLVQERNLLRNALEEQQQGVNGG